MASSIEIKLAEYRQQKANHYQQVELLKHIHFRPPTPVHKSDHNRNAKSCRSHYQNTGYRTVKTGMTKYITGLTGAIVKCQHHRPLII